MTFSYAVAPSSMAPVRRRDACTRCMAWTKSCLFSGGTVNVTVISTGPSSRSGSPLSSGSGQ